MVYTPTDQGTCTACGGGLFAIIGTYFADTGEPLESGVQVVIALRSEPFLRLSSVFVNLQCEPV